MRNLKVKLLAAAAIAALLASAAYAGVVTRNGQGYANPNATATNPVAVSADFASPHVHTIVSTIGVGSTDSINSIYNIGTIPTDAVIDPASLVYSSNNITGLTSMSCGFGGNPQPAQPLETWSAQPTDLVDAADWHSGTSFSLVSNVTEADYAEQVYQLLGLSLDPGGVVSVYCTVGAAPSATGTLQFFLKYMTKD
jgi:hypothetical protein